MKRTANSRQRLTARKIVQPGGLFTVTRQQDGGIRLTEPRKNPAPVVKLKKRRDGVFMLPVALSREDILAAIRADRDAEESHRP